MKHLDSLKERDSSLDIIRIVAFIGVISVHFFLNNGFYNQIVIGKRMYIMTVLRAFFMYCVPLFLILSGFVMNQKKFSLSYYLGILKTITIYVLASVFCLIYASINNPISFKDAILKIFNFSGAPYSWYIEMYLGLFFLVPFLNLAYHGLTNKKQKQILLLIMIFMTALPSVLNVRVKILPSWWNSIYPISYYYIGAYLSEYPQKIKTRYLLLLLVPYVALMGSYNYIKSYNQLFVWGSWTYWQSILNVITTTLIFLIIKNLNYQNWNLHIKAIIKYISSLTLGAYLLSWIADQVCYPILSKKVPDMFMRLEYMGIMILIVCVLSLLMSTVVTFFGNQITKFIRLYFENLLRQRNGNKKSNSVSFIDNTNNIDITC